MFNILLLRMIFASTYIVGKASFLVVKPLFFVGLSMGLSGLILLLWNWWQSRLLSSIKKEDWGLFLQLAMYQVYIPYAIDFYAAQYLAANTWVLIHAASPFVTALISWKLLKEVLSVKQWCGLHIGLLGITLVLLQGSVLQNQSMPLLLIPELIIIVSMSVYSYSWILIQRILPFYNALFINGVIMTMGGCFALITSLVCELSLYSCPIMGQSSFFVLSALNMLITLTGFPLYTYLLNHYSATLLAFSSFLEPLFVAFFSWMLFSETISVYFVCSLIMLTVGLYVFYKEELAFKCHIKES